LEIEKSRLLLRPASEKKGAEQKTKRSDTRHTMAKLSARTETTAHQKFQQLSAEKIEIKFQ